MTREEELIQEMIYYIQDHDVPSLIELVIKAIKQTEKRDAE